MPLSLAVPRRSGESDLCPVIWLTLAKVRYFLKPPSTSVLPRTCEKCRMTTLPSFELHTDIVIQNLTVVLLRGQCYESDSFRRVFLCFTFCSLRYHSYDVRVDNGQIQRGWETLTLKSRDSPTV